MEHCSSFCLDFPSWCKSFAIVPLHVSPSTHLICLTLYALTMLNFCRSSGRVCAWNLPEYKQQNSDKYKCFFLQLITVVFALHASAAFTTRTCTTYHFSYCFYLLQLISKVSLQYRFLFLYVLEPLFLY